MQSDSPFMITAVPDVHVIGPAGSSYMPPLTEETLFSYNSFSKNKVTDEYDEGEHDAKAWAAAGTC